MLNNLKLIFIEILVYFQFFFEFLNIPVHFFPSVGLPCVLAERAIYLILLLKLVSLKFNFINLVFKVLDLLLPLIYLFAELPLHPLYNLIIGFPRFQDVVLALVAQLLQRLLQLGLGEFQGHLLALQLLYLLLQLGNVFSELAHLCALRIDVLSKFVSLFDEAVIVFLGFA